MPSLEFLMNMKTKLDKNKLLMMLFMLNKLKNVVKKKNSEKEKLLKLTQPLKKLTQPLPDVKLKN
jgi:hypothetical protein